MSYSGVLNLHNLCMLGGSKISKQYNRARNYLFVDWLLCLFGAYIILFSSPEKLKVYPKVLKKGKCKILMITKVWNTASNYMSRLMTKTTKWSVRPVVHMKIDWVLSYPLSAQRRLWSDWADVLAVGGGPGWSESSLGAQSICWFFHEAARMAENKENRKWFLNSFLLSLWSHSRHN